MCRYRSRSAAASRPSRLFASGVSSPDGENKGRTGSSAATTRTTSAIAGISYNVVIKHQVRPTATYSVSKPDQPRLLEQLRGQHGAELPPGPYESWRVKLSDGTGHATAIMCP